MDDSFGTRLAAARRAAGLNQTEAVSPLADFGVRIAAGEICPQQIETRAVCPQESFSAFPCPEEKIFFACNKTSFPSVI